MIENKNQDLSKLSPLLSKYYFLNFIIFDDWSISLILENFRILEMFN